MAGSSRGGVVRTLRRNVDLRIRTFEDLIAGRRRPIDRRGSILKRRKNLVSAVGGRRSTKTGATDQSDEQTDTEETEVGTEGTEADEPTVELNDKVEIEVKSPTQEELSAANELAKKYEDADSVALVEENRARVEYDSGTSFTVRVSDALRGVTDNSETDSVPSSTPTMAEAAANK
jgi:hypothetical protein